MCVEGTCACALAGLAHLSLHVLGRWLLFPPSVPSPFFLPFFFFRLLSGVFRFRYIGRSPGEPLGSPRDTDVGVVGSTDPSLPQACLLARVLAREGGVARWAGPAYSS